MAKAVADPEEIRRFAHSLKKFSSQLSGQMSAMQGQMIALGQSWRDQEHSKFASEFDQSMRAMARFSESVDDHIPFLIRKADRLEEYLRQR